MTEDEVDRLIAEKVEPSLMALNEQLRAMGEAVLLWTPQGHRAVEVPPQAVSPAPPGSIQSVYAAQLDSMVIRIRAEVLRGHWGLH
jgi:hypothetical protein